MATAPSRVRTALQRVTGAAVAELRAVTAIAPTDAAQRRAALFTVAPLIVSEYAPGSATLALDWFEEIRGDAKPSQPYTPTPRLTVSDEDVAATVARVTGPLRDVEADLRAQIDKVYADAESALEAEVQRMVAAGFWDTMTGNSDDDPAATGWQRFTRPGACKFCLMLADRGAVFSRVSVRFAAHTTCHCVVGPSYDPSAPRADVMQYLASRTKRTEADKARLRAYLNHHFPDARG